jgi:hypothetical protein
MNVALDDMNVALDDIIEKVWMDIQQHVSESGATNIGNVTGTDINMNPFYRLHDILLSAAQPLAQPLAEHVRRPTP